MFPQLHDISEHSDRGLPVIHEGSKKREMFKHHQVRAHLLFVKCLEIVYSILCLLTGSSNFHNN